MKSELKLIDQISMKFEQLWNPMQGASEIFAFARSEVRPTNFINELCTELIIIDINRRWRHWGSFCFRGTSPDDVKEKLDKQISAYQYILEAQLRGINLTNDQIQQISIEEFLSRARYGNVPRPHLQLPSAVKKKIVRYQPRLAIHKKGEKLFEDCFWSPMLLGRQAAGEPAPYAWVAIDDQAKLICEVGRQPLVSRSQLSIQIVNECFAIIENLSTNRHFLVKCNDTVGPQERVLVKMPVEIDLGLLCVAITRSASEQNF